MLTTPSCVFYALRVQMEHNLRLDTRSACAACGELMRGFLACDTCLTILTGSKMRDLLEAKLESGTQDVQGSGT